METPQLPPVPTAVPPPTSSSLTSPSNDKLWIILCHLSLILSVGLILPLIVLLVKRQDSPLVAMHATEVLNFHLSLIIWTFCAVPFVFVLIGIPVIMVLAMLGFICAIIGAIRASEGGFYRYPITLRLIS